MFSNSHSCHAFPRFEQRMRPSSNKNEKNQNERKTAFAWNMEVIRTQSDLMLQTFACTGLGKFSEYFFWLMPLLLFLLQEQHYWKNSILCVERWKICFPFIKLSQLIQQFDLERTKPNVVYVMTYCGGRAMLKVVHCV